MIIAFYQNRTELFLSGVFSSVVDVGRSWFVAAVPGSGRM